MNVFKAVLAAALITLISLSAAFAVPAHAESPRYAYADLDSAVYICREKSAESALFIIPQTYCVEILSEEDGWYRVKYAEDSGIYRAVYGWCREGEVTKTKTPLKKLYLQRTVTVIYHTDSPSSFLPSLGDIELTAAYYGAYEAGGDIYSYVLCGDKFGYIDWQIGDYEFNELPSAPTFTPSENTGPDTKLIVALVIVLVATISVGALYFATRKSRPSGKQ